MILDTLDRADELLRGISPEFAAAADWLKQNAGKLETLPPGRIEVQPARSPSDALPDVYVNVEDTTLREADEALFERHRKYADIQVVISGPEAFEVSLEALLPEVPYDEPRDIEFFAGSAALRGCLMPGQFVVYLPGEAHKPALRTVPGAPASIRKAVVKVRCLPPRDSRPL